MIIDRNRKHLPPYISYRTFWNFISRLQEGIPARVDRSYWGDVLSGSTGNHLMATLRFLGLVDANATPTARLRQLVPARGEQRTELLKQITSESFIFLLEGSLDPQTATYSQLEEVFRDSFQSTGDVNRKCIKFFVALAADAGIPLSPHVIRRFRTNTGTSGTKTPAKRIRVKTNRNLVVPQLVPHPVEEIKPRTSWEEILLTKFPPFDPSWSEEVKLNWFKAFDALLKQGPANPDK